MTRAREQAIEPLTDLGSTALEAEVYSVLVEESPATADRVAQFLSKATGNVYGAGLRQRRHRGRDRVVPARGAATRKAWAGQWLNVVVDATEHLLALMRSDRGELVQAVWSGSSYLAVVFFSGLDAEMRNGALSAQIESGASVRELRKTIANWSASTPALPGVATVQKRLRSDS